MVPKMLIIVMLVGSACAATWIGRPPKKPKEFENKEGCYIEEIKDVIPYGTTITAPGKCLRISCENGIVDYASCGVAIVTMSDNNNCYAVEDHSKPYPGCCRTFECNDENEIGVGSSVQMTRNATSPLKIRASHTLNVAPMSSVT